MKHKKDQHTENVYIYWNYMSSNCEFGNKICWFIHTNGNEMQFDCTLCQNNILSSSKTVSNQKDTLYIFVKTCTNLSAGTRKYGKLKCWFNHNDSAYTAYP